MRPGAGAGGAEGTITPGDEVAITGLYRNHIGTDRIVPVMRSGIIASMPDDPVATRIGPMHGHLIEVRSVGGISGSPVYWMSDIYRYNSTGVIEMQTVTKVLLLGLVHGHWDEPYFARNYSAASGRVTGVAS